VGFEPAIPAGESVRSNSDYRGVLPMIGFSTLDMIRSVTSQKELFFNDLLQSGQEEKFLFKDSNYVRYPSTETVGTAQN
jgi:hypothetical protein